MWEEYGGKMEKEKWLEVAKKLQSIAQAGLEYSKDKYDIERFQEIREISIDILENHTDMERERIKDLFACETGYQTPKIDIRAAIFREDEILLVKEKLDGKWSLPGGWADIDLSIRENLVKEAMEEAGAKIIPLRILAIYDRNRNVNIPFPHSVYKIFVQCEYIESHFVENTETEEMGFFKIDVLPELSKTRNTENQIKMCFKYRDNESHEADFD